MSGVATVIEVYVAIIGACLPTLVPVYRQLRYGDPLKSSTHSTTSRQYYNSSKNIGIGKGSNMSKGSQPSSQGSFERLNENDFATADYQPTTDYQPIVEYQPNHHANIVNWSDSGYAHGNNGSIPMQGLPWVQTRAGRIMLALMYKFIAWAESAFLAVGWV